jgi:DNA-nicking Smr family endonuclease
LAPYTDQKLDDAAAALDQVSTLQQSYQDKAVAATPADRDRILEEGNQAVTKAVREHGFSVKEYAAFLTAAKNDPGVHEKVFQRIRRWRTHKG